MWAHQNAFLYPEHLPIPAQISLTIFSKEQVKEYKYLYVMDE